MSKNDVLKVDNEFLGAALLESRPNSDVLDKVVKRLKKAMDKNERLKGQCLKCLDDGTLVIDLGDGVVGYVPREEVTYVTEDNDKVHKGKCRTRVGLAVPFKVKEIKIEEGETKIILSRKAAMEEIRDYIMSKLQVGLKVQGVVTGTQYFGAFIDIGGDVEGVINVQDISRTFVKDPAEVLKSGDIVNVVLTEIKDDGKGGKKLCFNRKALLPDWDKIDEYFHVGETVVGTVKNPSPRNTGYFVQLNESFEGMADFVADRKLQYGDKVRVTIERIDKTKKRIKLRIE